MASYATVAEVAAEYKGGVTFSATTNVTSTTVQAFLDQATAQINGKIGMRYVLPITAADALTLLKEICLKIVKHRLNPIMKVATTTERGNQASGETNLMKEAEKQLTDIQNKNTDLVILGAVLISSDGGADSYGARNRGTTGDGNSGAGATFKKGVKSW